MFRIYACRPDIPPYNVILSISHRALCTLVSTEEVKSAANTPIKPLKCPVKSHARKVTWFFKTNPHIGAIKGNIPTKHLTLKRRTPPENLYLIDPQVAAQSANLILPGIKDSDSQLVCETNAGLGLISAELLDKGVKRIRLYESCSEFKLILKKLRDSHKGRVELFTKDIFLLNRYEYLDKQDRGNRVDQLLTGVTKRSWTDDPVMTIIGPLPSNTFIRYLMKCLVLQSQLISFGRIQLYTFMKPRNYVILTAGPEQNLHTYQTWSVLFNLFFDVELLDKFHRRGFLPWESQKGKARYVRYGDKIDPDFMYLVRINLKKELPLTVEHLLPLYSFVRQFFGKGNVRIIPTIEKWVPGSGLNALIPTLTHEDYYKNMNIFTRFGELTPRQILGVFSEMINHSAYSKSPFSAMIESQLIKNETIETAMDEHLEKTIVEDIDVKIT